MRTTTASTRRTRAATGCGHRGGRSPSGRTARSGRTAATRRRELPRASASLVAPGRTPPLRRRAAARQGTDSKAGTCTGGCACRGPGPRASRSRAGTPPAARARRGRISVPPAERSPASRLARQVARPVQKCVEVPQVSAQRLGVEMTGKHFPLVVAQPRKRSAALPQECFVRSPGCEHALNLSVLPETQLEPPPLAGRVVGNGPRVRAGRVDESPASEIEDQYGRG